MQMQRFQPCLLEQQGAVQHKVFGRLPLRSRQARAQAAPGNGSEQRTASLSRAASPVPLGLSKVVQPEVLVDGARDDGAAEVSTSGPSNELVAKYAAWWDALPSRYKVVLGASMSFVICNMVSLRQ
jgi:hypothetical protein